MQIIAETPKGSRDKHKYDKELGKLRFNRILFSAVHGALQKAVIVSDELPPYYGYASTLSRTFTSRRMREGRASQENSTRPSSIMPPAK